MRLGRLDLVDELDACSRELVACLDEVVHEQPHDRRGGVPRREVIRASALNTST